MKSTRTHYISKRLLADPKQLEVEKLLHMLLILFKPIFAHISISKQSEAENIGAKLLVVQRVCYEQVMDIADNR